MKHLSNLLPSDVRILKLLSLSYILTWLMGLSADNINQIRRITVDSYISASAKPNIGV